MRLPNLLVPAAIGLSACGTDPDDFSRCSGGLDITVIPAVQPEFAWTPSDCLVNEVAVDDASGPLWSLFIDEPANRIASPVRYGRPASAGESRGTAAGRGSTCSMASSSPTRACRHVAGVLHGLRRRGRRVPGIPPAGARAGRHFTITRLSRHGGSNHGG